MEFGFSPSPASRVVTESTSYSYLTLARIRKPHRRVYEERFEVDVRIKSSMYGRFSIISIRPRLVIAHGEKLCTPEVHSGFHLERTENTVTFHLLVSDEKKHIEW